MIFLTLYVASVGGLALCGQGGAYGYFWFRHHRDGSTFICVRDEGDGLYYMPAMTQGFTLDALQQHATLLGHVPRSVVGGGSIDQ